jgi:NifB/MoaA-like Fe-S oxidoreductase
MLRARLTNLLSSGNTLRNGSMWNGGVRELEFKALSQKLDTLRRKWLTEGERTEIFSKQISSFLTDEESRRVSVSAQVVL